MANGDITTLDRDRMTVKMLDAQGKDNLLTANQASVETDTTGFTVDPALGSTLTSDSTQYKFGAKSLKVVSANAAANEGFYTTNTTTTVSLPYTASVWVKGNAGGETIIVSLNERTAADANVGSATSGVITLTTSWQLIEVHKTFGGTGARARIYVTTDTQQAATFFCDGLQLEQNQVSTPFQLPGYHEGPWVEVSGIYPIRSFWCSSLEEGASDATVDILVSNAVTKPEYIGYADAVTSQQLTTSTQAATKTEVYRWVKAKKTWGTTPIATTCVLEAGRAK